MSQMEEPKESFGWTFGSFEFRWAKWQSPQVAGKRVTVCVGSLWVIGNDASNGRHVYQRRCSHDTIPTVTFRPASVVAVPLLPLHRPRRRAARWGRCLRRGARGVGGLLPAGVPRPAPAALPPPAGRRPRRRAAGPAGRRGGRAGQPRSRRGGVTPRAWQPKSIVCHLCGSVHPAPISAQCLNGAHPLNQTNDAE